MNPQQRAWETRRITHALSIKQPWAELIVRGVKVCEFRSAPTEKRERVYIYASLRPNPDQVYQEFGLERTELPIGVLVGTVDVVDCFEVDADDKGRRQYAYRFAEPRRLTKPLPPTNHPQPTWFRPFAELGK